MNRPKDRASSEGLLPRMEARPWSDGKTFTYRYHPKGEKPITLGTDRVRAIQRVARLIGQAEDIGTVNALWDIYSDEDSPEWNDLSPRTREDYKSYAVPLLKVFGDVLAADITAPMVARYLRVERKKARTRANREISLLGNLIGLAIDRGEAEHNPCRGEQVKRNRERPSTVLPEAPQIEKLVAFAIAKDAAVKTGIGRATVVVLAMQFAALTGARQVEFLPLHWPHWPADGSPVRMKRGKQRHGTERHDRIEVSNALATLRTQLLAYQTSPMGPVFPNQDGNVYTASGFASMWGKLQRAALEAGAISARFNFHSLRAFYTTKHKETRDALPDMHASPTTTARVYERSKVGKRSAL